MSGFPPARREQLRRWIRKEATPPASIVSFVGYIPAENHASFAFIIIDDAKLTSGLNYGGLVAAPIFSRVAEKAARYLDLAPAPAATATLPVAASQSGATKFRQ